MAGEAGTVINGTFPVERFFETLAMILSRRENMQITVKVTRTEETGTGKK